MNQSNFLSIKLNRLTKTFLLVVCGLLFYINGESQQRREVRGNTIRSNSSQPATPQGEVMSPARSPQQPQPQPRVFTQRQQPQSIRSVPQQPREVRQARPQRGTNGTTTVPLSRPIQQGNVITTPVAPRQETVNATPRQETPLPRANALKPENSVRQPTQLPHEAPSINHSPVTPPASRPNAITNRHRNYNPAWRYNHMPRRNSYVRYVPAGYHNIYYGGYNYRYHDGIFYRPYYNQFLAVAPPLGIYISHLPFGYHKLFVSNRPYYYYYGSYYDFRDNYYYVVSPPVGAVVESLPEGYKTIVIDGETYYEADGAQYKPVLQENGEIWYEVIKSNN